MFQMEINDPGEVVRTLKQALKVEKQIEPAIRKCAQYCTQIILSRIKKGLNSEGETMITQSPERLGNYSKAHGKKRRANNLTVSRVTLSFSGKTQADFTVVDESSREAAIGFVSDKAAQIAQGNDNYFGTAYQPNQEEIDEAHDRYLSIFEFFD